MTATTEQISVTRALAELKRLDDRIDRDIAGGVYVGVAAGTGAHEKPVRVGHMAMHNTVADMKSAIQSSFDRVDAAIARRAALKTAIVASNAKTMVTFMGKEMPVASAIEMKASIATHRSLLITIQSQMNQASGKVTELDAAIEAQVERLVSSQIGNDKSKPDATFMAAIRNQVESTSKPILIGGTATAKISELTDLIDKMETELDWVLSESNGKTMINV